MARDISKHKDQIEFHLQRLEQEYNSRQVRTRRSRKLRNCYISIPHLNVEREQRRLQSEELKDIHTRLMETMEGDSDSENEGEKEIGWQHNISCGSNFSCNSPKGGQGGEDPWPRVVV